MKFLNTLKGKVTLGALGTVLATAQAQAAITAPDFTSNIADLAIILAAAIGFGALIWGARKLLNFIG